MSLAELEALRKRTLFTIGIYFFLYFFLAGTLFFLGLRGEELAWGFSFVVLPSLAVFLAFFVRSLIESFRVRAKEALVVPLAEALGFRYSPDRGFSQKEVLASGLFPSAPDIYASKDLVEGKVNGIPFASSNITLYRAVRPADGFTMRKFFRGTLYRFHLPFSVEGEVRFGPRSMGMGVVDRLSFLINAITSGSLLVFVVLVVLRKLSAITVIAIYHLLGPFILRFFFSIHDTILDRRKGKRRPGRVPLESPEFERFYDAYGEDPVGARKLLTPRVQEALVHLREYFGKPVWGAVQGRDLWLLVKGGDRFPVPVLRPVSETFETWKTHYREELLEVFQVVEILKLEEEAKRRGVWRRKIFVDLSELPSVPKKNVALDNDGPQQTEDSLIKKCMFFRR